ncbi:MAG: hypothetical protein P1V51_16515 [Deltaproteobacteria bacterium]|nr:hypothetical protein [Deltaproteobacteria bacterium]
MSEPPLRDQEIVLALLRHEWERLEEEHLRMLQLFRALEAALDREGALDALASLERWLGHHFDHEERPGGLYDAVAALAAPQREAAAGTLAEHRTLVELMERIRLSLEAELEANPAQIGELTMQLGRLLREHEGHERRLVAVVLGPDPGGDPELP